MQQFQLLGSNAVVNRLTPVALPPGRLKLATTPSWTGSPAETKAIGIVVVAAFAASTLGVLPRKDHGDPAANQFGRQRRQPTDLTLRPSVLDGHVLALDVADLIEALPKCSSNRCSLTGRPEVEEPDHRHRRLLRPRRERPRRRRAAEQRDELAASDESCHLIPPAGRARKDSTLIGPCPGFTSGTTSHQSAAGPHGRGEPVGRCPQQPPTARGPHAPGAWVPWLSPRATQTSRPLPHPFSRGRPPREDVECLIRSAGWKWCARRSIACRRRLRARIPELAAIVMRGRQRLGGGAAGDRDRAGGGGLAGGGGDDVAQRFGPGAGASGAAMSGRRLVNVSSDPSKGYIVGGMLPAAAADDVEVALGQAKQAGVRLCRARQLLIARLVQSVQSWSAGAILRPPLANIEFKSLVSSRSLVSLTLIAVVIAGRFRASSRSSRSSPHRCSSWCRRNRMRGLTSSTLNRPSIARRSCRAACPSPATAGRNSRNVLLFRRFPGGSLRNVPAQAPRNLRGVGAQCVLRCRAWSNRGGCNGDRLVGLGNLRKVLDTSFWEIDRPQ